MKVKLIAAGCLLATAIAGWVVNSETHRPILTFPYKENVIELWTTDIPSPLEYNDYMGTQAHLFSPVDLGAIPAAEFNQQPPAGYPAEWHPAFSDSIVQTDESPPAWAKPAPVKLQDSGPSIHIPAELQANLLKVAGYLGLLIALAMTYHPIIAGWSPFLITLFGAMICPRQHILTRYRTIACIMWTIIAGILAVLGHWLGQTNIVQTFLVGLQYPSLRPLTDWLQKDDWLLGLMILAPIGPVFLWIIIMIQVIAGSSVMKLIRNLGIPPLILKLGLITAIAGTGYWLGLRKGTDDVTEAWNQEESIHVGTEIEWTLHKPYSSEIIGYKNGRVIHTNPNHDFLSQFDIDVQWDRSDKPESVHTNLSGEPTSAPGNVEHITGSDLSSALVMNLARFHNQRYWHGSFSPPRPDPALLREGIKSIGHLIVLIQAAKDLKVDPYAYNGAAQEESINTVQTKALWPEGKQFDWNMTMSDWWLFLQAQYHGQWSSGGYYNPLAYAIGNELKHLKETMSQIPRYDYYIKDAVERVSCAADYDFVLGSLRETQSYFLEDYKVYTNKAYAASN